MAAPDKTAEKADVYQRVTDHILQELDRGPGEWKLPWHVSASAALPVNADTQQNYRGINVLTLWVTAQKQGYESNLWATYKQWQELGAQVERGEKGTPVVVWKTYGSVPGESEERQEEAEKDRAREKVFARSYTVFNEAQVKGYSGKAATNPGGATGPEAAHEFFFGLGADIRQGGGVAFYEPRSDYVRMPRMEAFESPQAYYSTLAHEMTHWTGAEKRLGRDLTQRFGTKGYAAEELVAELGAAFQMARLGLSSEPRADHAAYIAHWVDLMKSDKRAVFVAAGKAQQAVDWLMDERERQAGGAEKRGAGEAEQAAAVLAKAVPERGEAVARKEQPGSDEQKSAAEYVARRAGYFDQAIRGYAGKPHERVIDVLADAQHWCKANGVPFEGCLARATRQYRSEEKELRQDQEREAGEGRSR